MKRFICSMIAILIFSSILCGQPFVHPCPEPGPVPMPLNDDFIRYHGRMLNHHSESFEVVFVVPRVVEERCYFSFHFNEPVNPDSVKKAEVLVNGKKIEGSWKFSKDGKKVRFLLPVTIKKIDFLAPCSLSLTGVESYSGQRMTDFYKEKVDFNAPPPPKPEPGVRKWQRF